MYCVKYFPARAKSTSLHQRAELTYSLYRNPKLLIEAEIYSLRGTRRLIVYDGVPVPPGMD